MWKGPKRESLRSGLILRRQVLLADKHCSPLRNVPVYAPFDRKNDIGQTQERIVAKYAVGDHVSWNSEAGRVSGTISKIHESDFDYKGHTRRASKDEPQYEIESDKTDHVAAHKEGALTKLKS